MGFLPILKSFILSPLAVTVKPCYKRSRSDFIMEKIEALKKITLLIEAGTTSEFMDLTPQPFEFDFIYGLGAKGLTPLELQLEDKAVGDEVRLQMSREYMPDFLQHLILPPINIPEDLNTVFLKFQILEVLPADQREVIKTLAEIADCGDDCCGH